MQVLRLEHQALSLSLCVITGIMHNSALEYHIFRRKSPTFFWEGSSAASQTPPVQFANLIVWLSGWRTRRVGSGKRHKWRRPVSRRYASHSQRRVTSH